MLDAKSLYILFKTTMFLPRIMPQKRILSEQLLKKYSGEPAIPFVSMIIFENQFFVKMMQYIKKETETY